MSIRSTSKRTTYCKVCRDSDKSEREYRSHNPKDRNGRTTCPTLLSLTCRLCKRQGHTPKYCDQQRGDVRRTQGAFNNGNTRNGAHNQPKRFMRNTVRAKPTGETTEWVTSGTVRIAQSTNVETQPTSEMSSQFSVLESGSDDEKVTSGFPSILKIKTKSVDIGSWGVGVLKRKPQSLKPKQDGKLKMSATLRWGHQEKMSSWCSSDDEE